MAQVIVSLLAQADTTALVADLMDKAGHVVATKYALSLTKLYERLADHPNSGSARPALGQHVRIGLVSPYIVIHEYEEKSNIVTIFRIIHERRRLTRKLLAPEFGAVDPHSKP